LLGATLIPVGLDQEASHRPPVGAAGELDLLLAGPEPVDTAEVIDSDAVAGLVGELRERYDLVFLDAPPLLPVGDARILSRVADAMVVVANLSVLRKPLLNELRSAIRACAAPPLGIVATGVTLRRRDAYAGYYYERRVGHMRRATREWAA
jgi:receptor protein-tyrosine kinase